MSNTSRMSEQKLARATIDINVSIDIYSWFSWEQMRQIEIYLTKYATPPQFHRIPVSFCKIQGFTCSRWIVSKILFINHDPNESNQRHPPKKSLQPSHNDLEMSAPQRMEWPWRGISECRFETPFRLCIELDWSLMLEIFSWYRGLVKNFWMYTLDAFGKTWQSEHSPCHAYGVCVCVAKVFQRFRHEMLNDCKQSHHTNWMSTKELINLNQCIWTRFTLKCTMSWQSTMYMVCVQSLQVPYMGKTQVWCWTSYNNRAHKNFGLMKSSQNLKFSRETSLEVMYFCLGPGCCSQHLLRCTCINNKR